MIEGIRVTLYRANNAPAQWRCKSPGIKQVGGEGDLVVSAASAEEALAGFGEQLATSARVFDLIDVSDDVLGS